MLLTLLSLTLSIASAADLDEDGCEDVYFDANSACVAASATIGSGVTVGASAVVGELASVGADTTLGSNAFVGARTTVIGRVSLAGARPIGANTVLGRGVFIDADHEIGADNTIGRSVDVGERLETEANVAIGYGSILGDDVTLRSGAVVGNLSGLGAKTTVETNAVLARGVTVLDSLTAGSIGGIIGPNVSIGGDNAIDATARIRKDATLGDDVIVLGGARIARGATIGDGVTIGANARIGAGAQVTATTLVPDGTVIARGEVYDDPSAGIFSGGTLLSSSEMDEINAWVGDPDANWTLCFQGSSDGFTPSAFHAGCDSYASSITVIQANGKKFGGYSSVPSSGSGYVSAPTSAAFLFSLTNSFKHANISTTHSYYRTPNYGPTWGGGHDLHVLQGGGGAPYCNTGYSFACRVGSYGSATCRNDLCGAYNFTASEVEVYGRD